MIVFLAVVLAAVVLAAVAFATGCMTLADLSDFVLVEWER